MKTTGILLTAFLALLLHDASGGIFKRLNCGLCGTDEASPEEQTEPLLAPRPIENQQNCETLPTNIKDYELQEKLGRGKYSVVMKAKVKKTEEIVAIKIIDKTKLTPNDLLALSEEAKIMKMIKHQNIIELLQDFEDDIEKKRYLVMNYASKGNVEKYLKKYGPMNETDARDKFGQIIDAVVYLHGENIVHRDLKPENLVITKNGVIKLVDFGFAVKITPDEPLDTFPGSRAYAPPEMLQGQLYDGPMAEVWTLGVVLYELLTRELAFYPDKSLTIDDVKNNIVNGTFSDPPGVSSECSAFIRRFLVVKPTERCKLKVVKEEENNWLKSKTIH